MMIVEALRGKTVAEHPVEIVERKGLGHPDTMCDSIMEAISVALSRYYSEEFGTILHHDIDKGLLAAGKVALRFGGGRVLKPMELTIGDRATFSAGGKAVPVADIAVQAAKDWIRTSLRFVDPERHVKYRIVLAPGSAELTGIFDSPGRTRPANDTSAAVGYYPLSPTEKAVLLLEKFLNSKEFKKSHPQTGEDVKVMGLRRGRTLTVTVAMPLLASHIRSERAYFDAKEAIRAQMVRFLDPLGDFTRKEVSFNALDQAGRSLNGVYLSLLGTSAEDADSGQVGRGNRVNGLISLNRPLGTEAAAGKNPVSHVGKIYNVFAHHLARRIYEKVEGLREVYVFMLSRIGSPVDRPETLHVQVTLQKGMRVADVTSQIQGICEGGLSRLGTFCLDLSRGRYPVC
jgi:S-adenosylmethionine synthetase